MNEGDIFTIEQLQQSLLALNKEFPITPIQLSNIEAKLDFRYATIDLEIPIKETKPFEGK